MYRKILCLPIKDRREEILTKYPFFLPPPLDSRNCTSQKKKNHIFKAACNNRAVFSQRALRCYIHSSFAITEHFSGKIISERGDLRKINIQRIRSEAIKLLSFSDIYGFSHDHTGGLLNVIHVGYYGLISDFDKFLSSTFLSRRFVVRSSIEPLLVVLSFFITDIRYMTSPNFIKKKKSSRAITFYYYFFSLL